MSNIDKREFVQDKFLTHLERNRSIYDHANTILQFLQRLKINKNIKYPEIRK